MDHGIYVKHDSDNCECCLDFWLGPQPQAREKEILESDADSGYCSITQTKEFSIPSIPIIPRIIVTPLSDEEQIEHNACIRAALIQRNAFTCAITSPSTKSLTSLSNEEKALPPSSSSASRSTNSFAIQSTTSRTSLTPPEESWSHRLKDTYENRMAWPQYFNIPTPHTSSLSSSSSSPSSSSSSPTSSTSIFSSALAAPHLRKRASKDAIELHPKVLGPPISTSRGQSLRKRWSIAGSGVGFGFGTAPTATTTRSPRTKVDSNPTPPRAARPTNSIGQQSKTTNLSSTKLPTAPTTISSASEKDASSLKRRSRVTSTQSLNDKPSSSSSVASSPSSSTSSLALPSQPSQMGGSGGGPGGALGRWGRALNSATGGVNAMSGGGNGGGGGGGGGGAFGKSMRSLKTLYSNAPSSFRML